MEILPEIGHPLITGSVWMVVLLVRLEPTRPTTKKMFERVPRSIRLAEEFVPLVEVNTVSFALKKCVRGAESLALSYSASCAAW